MTYTMLSLAVNIAAWVLFAVGLLGRLLIGMYISTTIGRPPNVVPIALEQAYFEAFLFLGLMTGASIALWTWVGIWAASVALTISGLLLLRGAICKYRRFESALFDRW